MIKNAWCPPFNSRFASRMEFECSFGLFALSSMYSIILTWSNYRYVGGVVGIRSRMYDTVPPSWLLRSTSYFVLATVYCTTVNCYWLLYKLLCLCVLCIDVCLCTVYCDSDCVSPRSKSLFLFQLPRTTVICDLWQLQLRVTVKR